MNADVEAHLRSQVNFPSPPGVATQIIEIARQPEIELSTVAKALSLDSALSSKILRVANSPLYAQRRKSENLRQALVVLGLNATLTLSLSFSLVKSLRSRKANGISYPLYWRRALLAATSARALADIMHQTMVEEIFLAGLLQDVGMLALDQTMPDLYRGEASQRDHAALAELEQQRLQTDHAAVGGWLMRSWNLPERLHVAISRSHHVELVPTDDRHRIFERCVALSGLVADLFLLDSEERRFAATAHAAQHSLGLDRMAFGRVLATIGSMIPETEALFESGALARQHPELILEQAREVLMLRSLQALREINTLRSVADHADSCPLDPEPAAHLDTLTGAHDRQHFDRALAANFAESMRHGGPLSVAVADLDAFETVNERFGAEAGDRILQATARILRSNARATDIIARYDGERFAILLPGAGAATARDVCERIVGMLRSTGHLIGSEQTNVTVSIGCATLGEDDDFVSPSALMNAADEALRAAKLRGRDRAVPYGKTLATALSRVGD